MRRHDAELFACKRFVITAVRSRRSAHRNAAREFFAMSLLGGHPAFLTLKSLWFKEATDEPHLAMEYVHGVPLSHIMPVMRSYRTLGGISRQVGLIFFRLSLSKSYLSAHKQVMVGLEFLHESEMVHRDIKPENIMLSFDGVVKIGEPRAHFICLTIIDIRYLVDYGFVMHRTLSDPCYKGMLCGTPMVMAPEIEDIYNMDFDCRTFPAPYSPLVDVFAWGASALYLSQRSYMDYFPREYLLLENWNSRLQGDADASEQLRMFIWRSTQPDPRHRWTAMQLLEVRLVVFYI